MPFSESVTQWHASPPALPSVSKVHKGNADKVELKSATSTTTERTLVESPSVSYRLDGQFKVF